MLTAKLNIAKDAYAITAQIYGIFSILKWMLENNTPPLENDSEATSENTEKIIQIGRSLGASLKTYLKLCQQILILLLLALI
jgi:hypothetical protein